MTRTTGGQQTERTGKAFWAYWTAFAVSMAGTAVTTVALPLTATLVLHASSFQVSALTAAVYAAWAVIGLPAGELVARLPLRGAMMTMDLVRAAVLASIPIAAWTGVLTYGQLLGAAVATGFSTVIFDVASQTVLPSLVDPETLTARNALVSGTQAVAQLGGPSLGGVLVQLFGGPVSMLADAISYLVSAVTLRALPQRKVPVLEKGEAQQSSMKRIAAGWSFVRHHPVIWPCTLAATAANFAGGGLLGIIPVYLVRTLRVSPGLVGVLMATEAAGVLLGATVTPKLGRKIGEARALRIAAVGGALLSLLMPLAVSGWGVLLFAAGNMAFNVSVAVLSIIARTYRQQATPSELLSRVIATVRFVSWGVVPIGALVVGAVASLGGNRAGIVVVCVLAWLVPLGLAQGSTRRGRELQKVEFLLR